ncbi:helix-turn-helix domain-containing protein [Micromonospora narathiwatensis]|uniref:Helix-turn-helix domain-containing protein n=1 Tax=Micromonospora narathiwatensis TaxID=299146 RepID=A0A1A8Z4L8_9ACTN|nr:helix-turn-helix transcriptional regulator [Micromonospora narathiwatensis]SBT38881.1 Helix-turn-helix domain-containing protein [Micromonospora narathiwatensis]
MPHKPFIRTLRAQWLGQQLRALREERGMTLKLVSEHLQRDMSALGRYERADWPIRKGDVTALLDLYGFHNAAERARLLALAEEVWRTDRWDDDYGDVVDSSFIEYPWLEGRAEKITSYNTILLPGLMQTRDYAEAVIRNAEKPDVPAAKIARWVQLRLERQKVLDRSTRVAAVLDESVLRRLVGGRRTMSAQLQHLHELALRRNVEVRVLPSSTALHAGLDGSFTLFTLPRPYPAVAYLENLAGRLYVEAPKSMRFVHAYDRLREAALGTSESAQLIASIVEELS